jgi:hypothetical protein
MKIGSGWILRMRMRLGSRWRIEMKIGSKMRIGSRWIVSCLVKIRRK